MLAPLTADRAGQEWLDAMRRGDFPAAWEISDAVLAARDPATRDDPALPFHLRWVWDGRPLEGRSVLVRCYHGLGDTLQFCRYVPLLRPRVAALTLETQPELVPLLTRLLGLDQVVPFDVERPLPASDAAIEIMELAHALRLPPPAPPYLHLMSRCPHDAGLSVGLCWAAGGWDPDRSVPVNALAPLTVLPGLHLVSLQRGSAAAGAGAWLFATAQDHSMDVLRTARTVAGLDLVVTVDTMVAHLAAALGRPTWLLLKFDADWRWGRTHSPWYPAVRQFRQSVQGDWTAPIAALVRDLRRRLKVCGPDKHVDTQTQGTAPPVPTTPP